MIFWQSKFDKAKRNSECKYNRGPFYSNYKDNSLFVPSRLGYGMEVNIAHPKFRRSLLYIAIGIIVLNVIAALIF
ncbi:MAG: hypothetical protein GQ564_10330 [Bacteroidales bacterium]|nr:hypothetical protein [Bacteroidales bacterium]